MAYLSRSIRRTGKDASVNLKAVLMAVWKEVFKKKEYMKNPPIRKAGNSPNVVIDDANGNRRYE